jgi:hypothetical protein
MDLFARGKRIPPSWVMGEVGGDKSDDRTSRTTD